MKWNHLFVLLSVTMNVYAVQITCPETIMVKEGILNQKDWGSTDITQAKKFKGSTLFVGKLGDRTSSLAPEVQKGNHKITQKWNLKSFKDHRETIWLECQYFETNISLHQIIPNTINECQNIFELDQLHNPKGNQPMICR